MYVTAIPNRNSPPAILLRQSYRQNGKVKTRTIANITHLRPAQIDALRRALSGSASVTALPLPDAFRIERSRPHGHVAAVLGSLRKLQLTTVLDPQSSRQRDLVVAMIAARILDPASKLATARGLHSDTLHSSLGESLAIDSADETELYSAMFDKTDMVEIAHPDFPGERLVACFNPLLAEERARKRPALLAATEKQLEKIAVATKRARRPLRGKQNIGLRAGKILNRYKMGKHFELRIEEDSFQYKRKEANIEREQGLDGIYVIRTSVKADALSSEQVVASYKSLSGVERAFRSLKTVDLQVRPIHHRLPDRVRAHILLCMLAYYVEWHMRQWLAPILFDDHDKPQARTARVSIVAPAKRSDVARRKAARKMTDDGLKVHSFQTLLGDLGTVVKNRILPKDKKIPAFDMLTTPTTLQQKAFDLLGVTLRLN